MKYDTASREERGNITSHGNWKMLKKKTHTVKRPDIKLVCCTVFTVQTLDPWRTQALPSHWVTAAPILTNTQTVTLNTICALSTS